MAICIAALLGCDSPEEDRPSRPDGEAHLDLNSDGRPDVQLEPSDGGYYELVDRNFDGKADERSRYDMDSRWLGAQSDDDFDGYMETRVVARNGLVSYMLVDTDADQLIDLVFAFTHGLVVYGERFYSSSGSAPAAIATVGYDSFGYPSAENRKESALDAQKYHDNALQLLDR